MILAYGIFLFLPYNVLQACLVNLTLFPPFKFDYFQTAEKIAFQISRCIVSISKMPVI